MIGERGAGVAGRGRGRVGVEGRVVSGQQVRWGGWRKLQDRVEAGFWHGMVLWCWGWEVEGEG